MSLDARAHAIIVAAERLARAEQAKNQSLDLYPLRQGVEDTPEGKAHGVEALKEYEAAAAAVVAAAQVDGGGLVQCPVCKGSGKVFGP